MFLIKLPPSRIYNKDILYMSINICHEPKYDGAYGCRDLYSTSLGDNNQLNHSFMVPSLAFLQY